MKILLVEGDKKLNNTISEYLIYKDFKVISSYNGDSLFEQNQFNSFDLCIISDNLPKLCGLDLLKYIKEISPTTPVIVISSKDSISELERAFFYGCDDFIKKPFHLKELELRIYKLLNMSHLINIQDDLIFNLKTSNLYHKNNLITLRKKEKFLLNILVSNRGKIVPKEKIIEYVWNDTNEGSPVRQLVSNLREKLPMDIIKTEVGSGYKIL